MRTLNPNFFPLIDCGFSLLSLVVQWIIVFESLLQQFSLCLPPLTFAKIKLYPSCVMFCQKLLLQRTSPNSKAQFHFFLIQLWLSFSLPGFFTTIVLEWRSGEVVKWRSELRSGGVAKWRSGGVAECEVAKWRNGGGVADWRWPLSYKHRTLHPNFGGPLKNFKI